MFKSLKLCSGCSIELENIIASLVEFGYKKQENIGTEGDFSVRGAVLDIFPSTFELPLRVELDIDKISSIKTFNLSDGISLWEHKMAIILPIHSLLSRKARLNSRYTFKAAPLKEEYPIDNFIDLDIGDYIVHNQHGIGKFLGVDKIKIGQAYTEHIIIEYDRNEKLFVPIDRMNLIQKYIAFAVRRPKLNRLGSKEWQNTKVKLGL